MTDIKLKERLYLSKAEDIFIEYGPASRLMQHQIDALRLLYSTFKKKKGGVILNDPSGYGKTVVAVLFLHALRKILPSPALVLCRPAELQHWRHHFHTWATTEDIIFESTNPYVKKSVFVNTRQQLVSVTRRVWSVAVVDEDLPRELQADFKIYLTHDDMKENLLTFSSIYQWMYPKEDFDIKVLIANKNDPVDVQRKSVLTDFFFEDIVFRSKNFTPFKKPETQTPVAVEPPRISRKNKDATGTKIKRSKARIEAETNHAAKIPRTEHLERNSTITSKDYYKDKEMDVESFIRNEKPITGEGVEEFMDFQTMIRSDANDYKVDLVRNDSANGDVVTVKDENESENVCTADYQNAINDIVNNENVINEDENKLNDRINEDTDTGKVKDNNDSIHAESTEQDISVSNNKSVDVIEQNKDTGKAKDNDSIYVKSTEQDISVSNNKSVDVIEENKAETIQDVVNKGSKKDLESKISELEEKTLNKFKGSLLDSIF